MKVLYVTTISLTMNTFFKPHIDMLVREGHHVDIACNDKDLALDPLYSALGCGFYRIDFSRSPLSMDNVKAYGQLKKVIADGNYDIVHCHTPNASMITRLVCRKFRKKSGLKVFYTAHGFHFYEGAPLLNWLVFYPVEKFCSRFTDKLITINKEDYARAKEKFHAGEVRYVPGVGIDLSRFENIQVDRAAKRREIGVPVDAVLLLSVGELNENKNHQIIVKALAKLNNPNVHYAIAGVGDKREHLLELAQKLGVSDRLHLLGYRKDVPELNHVADVFCFPSCREGLGLAAIEAMACGLPLITSNVHGINDYSVDNLTGYKCEPADADAFANAIGKLAADLNLRKTMGQSNTLLAKKYEVGAINLLLKQTYGL
jgi:glycosyltransferase involved in cell wall biosynthesis